MAAGDYRRSLLLRWETLVFAVVILLRLWVVNRYTTTPYSALQTGDMKFYHDWAVRILHGQWTDGAAFYGLPGYAYLLAGFYKVLGSDFPVNWLVIGVVQSAIEALTAVLIFKIARRCCETESQLSTARGEPEPTGAGAVVAGLCASLAYALFIPAQAFSIILMPTSWLVCAFWFCVWQAMRGGGTNRIWRWFGLGLLVGVMAMMIATILFVLPILLCGIAVRIFREEFSGLGRAAVCAVTMFAGVGIGTSPAWLHNYFVAHDPVLLSAHGGLNFWMGNNPTATGYPKIPEGLRASQDGLLRDSIKWVEAEAGHSLKRTEVSKYWAAKANAYIREHPGDWLRLMGRKIRNFWNGFQYDDISVVTLIRERGVALPGLSFFVVSALGLAGILTVIWRNRPARWVAAAVLLHMAALLSVFITERYRMAAVPGLIVLGTCAIWRLGSLARAQNWAKAAAVLALIAASAVWTNGRTTDPALLSLDPYNLGVKELAAAEEFEARTGSPEDVASWKAQAEKELGFAKKHLESAYTYMPGNAGVCFALGNLSLSEKDSAKATEWYQKTLDLEPNNASAHKNLGYLLIQQEQWATADTHLESACSAEPDNATTWYLRALAKKGLGDTQAARRVLNQALRMKPAQPEFRALEAELSAPAPTPSPEPAAQ